MATNHTHFKPITRSSLVSSDDLTEIREIINVVDSKTDNEMTTDDYKHCPVFINPVTV